MCAKVLQHVGYLDATHPHPTTLLNVIPLDTFLTTLSVAEKKIKAITTKVLQEPQLLRPLYFAV